MWFIKKATREAKKTSQVAIILTVFILLSASSRMIRIILHLSVLVIIQPSSKPFQRVFTLFLSNFVEIPIELYSSIYFKLLFPPSFHRRNQLYLMDNVNKPQWESRTDHAGQLLQKRRKARTLHTSFGTRSSCFCKRILGSSIRNITF